MDEIILGNIVTVTETFRLIFIVTSLSAIVFLLVLMKKNKERRGFGISALIYFISVFVFYFLRHFGIPASAELSNILSNIIRLVGSIFILYTAYELLVDGKHLK